MGDERRKDPKECTNCDCPISDDAEVCECCGQVVEGSKLDQEIEDAYYNSIQPEIDKYLNNMEVQSHE
jgi:hypothetical protein